MRGGAAICRHAQWNFTHACLILLNCRSYRCRGSRGVVSVKVACGQSNEIFTLPIGRNTEPKRPRSIEKARGRVLWRCVFRVA